MFKFAKVFILLEILSLLAADAQGYDQCCAAMRSSQVDLKSDVKALQELVQELRSELREQFERPPPSRNGEPKKVAFFAGLSKSFGPVSQDTDLIFDNLVTNVGSAFDRFSGRFTAPVRATYQFSVTIAGQHGKSGAVNVLKNGVRVMTVWGESVPNWAMSTSVPILSLEAGDRIWLQLRKDAPLVYGNMYTSFSGLLLFDN